MGLSSPILHIDKYKDFYPKIRQCLDIIAHDNCLILKDYPRVDTGRFGYIEHELRQLSDKELETFCIGEESEIDLLRKRLARFGGLADDFLNRVFDGDLHDVFFVENY